VDLPILGLNSIKKRPKSANFSFLTLLKDYFSLFCCKYHFFCLLCTKVYEPEKILVL